MNRALAFVSAGSISLAIVSTSFRVRAIVCPVKFPRSLSLRDSTGGVIGPSAVLGITNRV